MFIIMYDILFGGIPFSLMPLVWSNVSKYYYNILQYVTRVRRFQNNIFNIIFNTIFCIQCQIETSNIVEFMVCTTDVYNVHPIKLFKLYFLFNYNTIALGR